MAFYQPFGSGMDNLFAVRDVKSRSICPENPTGAPGGGAHAEPDAKSPARDLGKGWKVRPCVDVAPGETLEMCDIEGPGMIQHIWMTLTGRHRDLILRVYWEGQAHPSVECPAGDFFASGWGQYAQVSSLAVCVNPGSGFNCYWQMPFKTRCKITLENRGEEGITAFYQIDYALQEVPENAGYFCASFRRTNPVPYKEVYTILDGVTGRGQYVGTYMCWGVNNNGWWGEGEIKFYMDDDDEYPTICGTGTEDYFCGSYNFENRETHQYQPFSTPYAGMPQVIRPNGVYDSQQRFGLYRWHITDPIHFDKRLRITIQDLGWRSGGRFLPQKSDISSVAFWYQELPGAPLKPLMGRDELEII